MAIGFAIAFVLALIAHRVHHVEQPIPARALRSRASPVPVLFIGIWTRPPSRVALVGYTLVILFPAILVGPERTARRSGGARHGYGGQILTRVELPLAVPAIIGGLRVAVVSTISIATIAAFLLPKGLGYPIFVALKEPTPFKTEIYSAGALCVALAIACDTGLVALRRVLVPWTRTTR
jgi:osmoprotectant transport system permease protein